MGEGRRYTWLLEVEVPEHWVERGFHFDESLCRELADCIIRFAYTDPVQVRVVRAPAPDDTRLAEEARDNPP